MCERVREEESSWQMAFRCPTADIANGEKKMTSTSHKGAKVGYEIISNSVLK